MKDPAQTIEDILGKQFQSEGYQVELVRIPKRGDRMVRIRTLEEALEEFDSDSTDGSIGYLVQLRPRQQETPDVYTPILNEPSSIADELRVSSRLEGIYLPNGGLNLSYLIQNAELLFASGEYTLARNIYKTILDSGEKSAFAHFWIARCHEAEGQTEEAQKYYEESIAFNPTLEAYQHLAAILIRKRKDQEAAEVLERALSLKNISEQTQFELQKSCGNCWMRAGNFEKARNSYLLALEINQEADETKCNLGALYLQVGNTTEAKRYFQEILSTSHKNDKALTGLGSCFLAENDKKLAHDYFAKSLDANLKNPTAVFHLIKCAYEIKSYATAARITAEYIEVAPINLSLLYSLAGLQFHLGRMEQAKSTVQKVLELQPQHTGANELLKLINQYTSV
jgi:tetratricopeptide (TPR) repeat protein